MENHRTDSTPNDSYPVKSDRLLEFLVTARHVAKLLSRFDEFFIRINMLSGSAREIPISRIDWIYPTDNSVDLAAATVAFPMDGLDLAFYKLLDDNIVNDVAPNDIACGDPINLVGLFRLHAGTQRNVPIVHTGNIALLPDKNEPVPLRDRVTNEVVNAEVYLVEAQTLDGLSGSPALVHDILDLELAKLPSGGYGKIHGRVRLLGLYVGSWDGEPGTILAADRNLRGGTRVPVGMGIVVPGKKIIELLREHPDMKALREREIRNRQRQNAASLDSALPPPTNDENPNAREDFDSLMGGAAPVKATLPGSGPTP
jgi:hypothetical protein